MGFKNFIIASTVLGIIIIATIMGGVWLTFNNGGSQSIGNDTEVSNFYNSLQQNLSKNSDYANSSEQALSESPKTLGTGSFILDAIGGIWKTLIIVPKAVYGLTIGIIKDKILGDQSFTLIVSLVSATLITLLILFVWKWVYTGDHGK